MAYTTSWYIIFLDETMGENPWAMAQRPLVQSENAIWMKKMDHLHFFFKFILLKKNRNVVALIFY
jgi:hypothetical protein